MMDSLTTMTGRATLYLIPVVALILSGCPEFPDSFNGVIMSDGGAVPGSNTITAGPEGMTSASRDDGIRGQVGFDMGSVSGPDDVVAQCTALLNCLNQCGGGPNCNSECAAGKSSEAVKRFNAMTICARNASCVNQSGNIETACFHNRCTREVIACLGQDAITDPVPVDECDRNCEFGEVCTVRLDCRGELGDNGGTSPACFVTVGEFCSSNCDCSHGLICDVPPTQPDGNPGGTCVAE